MFERKSSELLTFGLKCMFIYCIYIYIYIIFILTFIYI